MKLQQGNYSELELPQQAIDDICHSGNNEVAVSAWLPKLKLPTDEAMYKEMSEYGDYSDRRDDIALYYVWTMAWNAYEDQAESA